MQSKLKFNVLILIIVVVLLAIGLVYFLNNSQKLNKKIVLNEVSNNEINKPVELVKKEDDKLIFQLDDGKETILQDVLGETDVYPGTGATENQSKDSRFYTFDKLYDDINHYGVNVGYYVGMDSSSFYLLINKKNGNQVSVVSKKIIISPDRRKVVSYNLDLESGFTFNGFNILNLKGDNFRKEFQLEPTDWGPSNARWINDSEVEFEKTVLKGDYNEEIIGVVRYKLVTDKFGNNTWVEVK